MSIEEPVGIDLEKISQEVAELQEKFGPDILGYNVAVAELYTKIAQSNPLWKTFAIEALHDAITVANQKGNSELCNKLSSQMKEFE